MKSVLISIHPKWCELIANGQKTVEVRRTRPKLEPPFKCYIYETKARSDVPTFVDEEGHVSFEGRGQVIGEFICDRIDALVRVGYTGSGEPPRYCIRGTNFRIKPAEGLFQSACLTESEAENYLKGRYGFGWHISDLHIYDKPRELSESKKFSRECFYSDLGYAIPKCPTCNYPGCFLKRPPQDWCYVEGNNGATDVL